MTNIFFVTCHLKLRRRDIRTHTESEGEETENTQTSSPQDPRRECSDGNEDTNKDISGNTKDNSTGEKSHALSAEFDRDNDSPDRSDLPVNSAFQTSSVCSSVSVSDSLSSFHNLIQQVLDNQHTIYEKLQQIEEQISGGIHLNPSSFITTPPSQLISCGTTLANIAAINQNTPTVVWPEGTNVFMQSGAVKADQKLVHKKAPNVKTNVKKPPANKSRHSFELSEKTLEELKKQAKSQVNLSVKLMTTMTSKEERRGRAVYGNRNKQSLNPEAVNMIKKYYFHVYPSRHKHTEWAKCVTAMNLHLRKMK